MRPFILSLLLLAAAGSETTDWPARLARCQLRFRQAPTAEGLCGLLDTLALADRWRADEDSLRRELLSSWLGLVPEGGWTASTTLRLAEHADALAADSLSAALRDRLLTRWPDSTETWEAMQLGYLAALYPVWGADSATIAAMERFIEAYGRDSDYWRSRALAVIVSATRASTDSSQTLAQAMRWVRSCPQSPEARLAAGRSLLKTGAPDSALSYIQRGIGLLEDGWSPTAMPEPESALTLPLLRNDLAWRRSQALAALGDTGAALDALRPLLDPGLYADSVHHTPYDYLVEAAGLRSALGDTAQALELLLRARAVGRTRSDSAHPAAEMMAGLLGPRDPTTACREIAGYSGPVFRDVTDSMLLDGEADGRRIAWCDYDRDGWPDLLAGRTLFRNVGGRRFERVPLRLPLASGGVWGDVNRDGWPDLVTCGQHSRVLLSRGGRLDAGPLRWQPRDPAGPTEGVGLLDYDGDGWLDIYLARYEPVGKTGEGTADLFCLGGPGGLRPAGDSLGMDGPRLCGRGVSPCDFDRDGDGDILVSNYRLQRNLLWVNRGTAVDMAAELGVEDPPADGMHGHTIGSAWADWDNDGDWDLFCANLAHPRYIRFSRRSRLLRNDGDGFADATPGSGIRYEETHSVPVWGDFDGDGLQDLYITSVYAGRRSFLYRNRGDGTFTDVTFLAEARLFDGWGGATADFDGDGRLDLAVSAGDGLHLLRNVTPSPGQWLLVDVLPDSAPQVGAVLEVRQGGDVLLRQVEGGSGTSCQSSRTLHLALPDSTEAEWSLYLPGDSLPAASGRLREFRRRITVP